VLSIPKDFTILDAADAAEAIGRCCAPAGSHVDRPRLPKAKTLQSLFSRSVATGQDLSNLLADKYSYFAEAEDAICEVQRRYVKFKQDAGYLDFDDLIVLLHRLLRNDHVRDALAERYRYVMVDEYQDTNHLEAEIACLLGRDHGNLMIVGDDAQSIYGFRGADYRDILSFPNRVKGCHVVKLEQNYRSTQAILDLANAVLNDMREGYSKCLRSASDVRGEPPVMAMAGEEADEATWVADQVRRNDAAGVDLARQAVLYRSSFVSARLQLELQALRIPFRVVGGPRFTDAPHVKDMLSHLRLVVDRRDVLAWGRVLRCAGNADGGLGEQLRRCADLPAACQLLMARGIDSARLAETLLLGAARAAVPHEVCEAVAAYCTPLFQRRYDDWADRAGDVEALCRIAREHATLGTFLSELLVDPSVVPASMPEGASVLTLSTIHSAKGLEWDVVYLMGLSDGVFPDRRSVESDDELEEERRLLYVAITRAKRKLLLSTRGGDMSRFLGSHGVRRCLSFVEVATPSATPGAAAAASGRTAMPPAPAPPPANAPSTAVRRGPTPPNETKGPSGCLLALVAWLLRG